MDFEEVDCGFQSMEKLDRKEYIEKIVLYTKDEKVIRKLLQQRKIQALFSNHLEEQTLKRI